MKRGGITAFRSGSHPLPVLRTHRGEIVEDVQPPLPLSTPLLLVKPPAGLSTPQVFRALDLDRRSSADPRALLAGLASRGVVTPELCANDLEQPAFDVLPDLAALKRRLTEDSGGRFSAVFMTGAAPSDAAALTSPCCGACSAVCLGDCDGGMLPSACVLSAGMAVGTSDQCACVPCAGSGSTIVCVGSDEPPAFLQEDAYRGLFVSPARLIARDAKGWYQPSRALVGAAA